MQFSTSISTRGGVESSPGLLFILIAVVSLLAAAPVWAQTDIVSFNNIELDGDTDKDLVPPHIPGIADWDDVYADCLADPANCTPTTTGALRQAHVDDSGTDFTVFDGGLKDIHPIKDWSCNSQPVQNKSDILHAYGATYLETYALPGEDPIDHIVFYGGADRLDNNGSANFGIWLFQTPVGCDSSINGGSSTPFTGHHVDGDLLLVAEFDRGGSVTNINVYKWTDPTPLLPESGDECLGNGIDCSPANVGETFATGVNCGASAPGDQVCGITNDTLDVDTAWRTAIPTNGFYEAGSNLSDLIGHGELGCFASAMIETRSTTELTAQLKDFVFLDLSTCGTLDVVKVAEGNQAQNFGFGVDPDPEGELVPNVFDLTGGQNRFFGSVEPGTYTITEAAPAGWNLTDISCTGGAPGAPNYVNGGADGGDIEVGISLNDDVVCTFTNQEPASITVIKHSEGGDDTFDFYWASAANGATIFPVTTVSGTSAPGETFIVDTGLGDSDFVVAEALGPGWQFVSAQCLDEEGLSVGTYTNIGPDHLVENITLNPGDHITCTFSNQASGTVVIEKNAIGGDGVFNFTSSLDLGAPLGTDFNIVTTNNNGSTGAIINLPTGTFTITETDPQLSPGGWDFTDLSCSEGVTGDGGTSVNLAERTATIDLDAGETISCVFTNTKRGEINVVKNTLGGDDTFNFTSTELGGFAITTAEGTGDPNAQFSNLLPGVYDIAETAMAGWDLDTATCDDGSNPAAIDLTPGEIVTCTFTNIKRGSIEIVKNITAWSSLDPQPASKTFTFDAGGAFRFDGVGGVSIQTSLAPPDEFVDATTGPIEVVPGLFYSVTEADPTPDGWALLSASCDDGSDPTIDIDVQPGEDIVCTFTNQPLGSAVVQKTTVGGEGAFEFSWGNLANPNVPEASSGTFVIDTTGDGGTDSMDFSNKLLVNAPYDLSESLLPAFVGPYSQGWFLTNVGCADLTSDSSVPGANGANATIVADTGETVSCVFTNTLEGALVIRKETVPDGLEVGFDFTGSVNNTLMDYSTYGDEAFVLGLPANGPYDATESVPDGWALTNISCVAEDGVLNSTVTIGDAGLFDVGDEGVSVDLAAGEVVVCTFENTLQGGITIIKNVIGADAGFNFSAPEYDADGFVLSNGQFNHSGPLMAGVYNITESVASGYQLTDLSCYAEDGQLDSIVTPGVNGVQVNLATGEDVVCTFTNTQLGSITVEKQTLPDGSAQAFEFVGDVAGLLSDGGTATINKLPGTYTSTETVPAGWDLTSVVCNDGNSTGDVGAATATYRLEAGENVTCTFTNTQRANLTLVKHLPNDNGGTAIADDFQAYIDASPAPWGVAQELLPGNYVASEDTQDGYVASAWFNACDPQGNVTLQPGDNLTCEITNDDIAPNLTLVKVVVTDDGGDAEAADWMLNAAGPTPIGGAGGVSSDVDVGTYTLSETGGPAGYTASAWVCTGDGVQDGASITLTEGQSATCTITNDDIPPRITVVKQVEGMPDGEFCFDVSGPQMDGNFCIETSGGIGHDEGPDDLYAGLYSIVEIVTGQYYPIEMACDNGDSADAVYLNPGDDVTCTFVNVPVTAVPVNNPWALMLLTLMMLLGGWYFRPLVMRGH